MDYKSQEYFLLLKNYLKSNIPCEKNLVCAGHSGLDGRKPVDTMDPRRAGMPWNPLSGNYVLLLQKGGFQPSPNAEQNCTAYNIKMTQPLRSL